LFCGNCQNKKKKTCNNTSDRIFTEDSVIKYTVYMPAAKSREAIPWEENV
jgi:hypothetical protein